MLSLSEHRYELPPASTFLKALLLILKQQGKDELASLLSAAKLSFDTTSRYAYYLGGSIPNAYGAYIVFAFPPDQFEYATNHFGQEEIKAVVSASDKIMPKDSGYEIVGASTTISLENISQPTNALQDIQNIANKAPREVQQVTFPEDILQKASEMSQVYVYTYCIENALRAFIVSIAQKHYGVDYLTGLKLNSKMRDKIAERKGLQEKKKWMTVRGDSDIYYLDIDDLAKVIAGNWDIFEKYFQSFEWISTQIKEIGDCRDAVAHHSYLQQHERDVIRLDFIKILKQISESYT